MTVVPSANPASSKARFEMLFEPGTRTVPPTLASGGMSRKRVANMTRLPGLSTPAVQRCVFGVAAFICQPARASLALRISASSASVLPVLTTCSMASSA